MKTVYTYLPGVNVFDKKLVLEDDDIIPEFSTTEMPPVNIDTHVAIIWNSNISEWEYQEIPLVDINTRSTLNELLDYSKLREMQYPPKEMYLDGIVKGDQTQVDTYLQLCLSIKAKWPKDMEPITRREYYIREYNMKPFASTST